MLFLIFSLFIACQSKEDDSGEANDTGEDGIDCTMEFRYSATISIVDEAGAPLSGVDVSYTVNGTEGSYVENFQEGIYNVGGEESGDFVVHMMAEIPDESDPCCKNIGEGTLEFTIEADECHVQSQAFDTSLEWNVVCSEPDTNGSCE